MSVRKGFLGAMGLALLAMGIQLPIQAQTVLQEETKPVPESASVTEQSVLTIDDLAASDDAAELTANENVDEIKPAAWTNPENLSAEGLALADDTVAQVPEASTLAYPTPEESTELAQARRRTNTTGFGGASNFIGIGADFGTTDDISFAAISRFSLSDQVAIRPSVLIGDGFAVLVPVTYDFSRATTSAGGFQIRPYAGAGASYVDGNDDSNLGLLLSAGVDVPLSRQFTANAQANFAGIFSEDTNFGVTVGVGYNFSGFQ